jgi:hypothetical protein
VAWLLVWVGHSFLKDFLDINDDALQSYYRTLVFTGRGSMPKALDSEADVVAYVTKTRGAIGYVSSTAAVDGGRSPSHSIPASESPYPPEAVLF